MDNNIGISIIVCCYNSAKRLPQTILHLAKQIVPEGLLWEVIIVDNNSKDNTAEVANNEWELYKLNIPFKIVEQTMPGLSFAREKGIDTAKYEYLLFCDDDNWLCNTYVEQSFNILNKHPDVSLVGGGGEYVCEGKPPVWFDEFSGSYATGQQLKESGIAPRNITFYGAGAVIRKKDYLNLDNKNFKFLLSGRQGKKLLTGEDRELCYAFILNGKQLYYDSNLKFKHFIPKERHTFSYYSNMMYNCVPASIILHCYNLNVINIYNRRSATKNSYYWCLLMLIIQNIKHFLAIIIPYIKKRHWQFLWMEIILIIKYITYWLKNKRLFSDTFNNIRNAEYNQYK